MILKDKILQDHKCPLDSFFYEPVPDSVPEGVRLAQQTAIEQQVSAHVERHRQNGVDVTLDNY